MKKRLLDIAEFRMGYQFRGKVKPDPAGTVRVVQIKDIDSDLRIRVADLVTVTLDRPEPYRIQVGDVLFLGRGHRLYAVLVPEVEPNTIATGYFFILRPNPRAVLPAYLAWSLNQPDFQESLRPFHRGSHVPMVSRTDVEELRIEAPPLDVQQRILTLNGLLDRERRLCAAILEKRRLLAWAVSRKLMRETGDLRPPLANKDD
ncbi:MAG: restriction endonuclease subunit S [Candidatus Competibacter sp.]|nr:restriction endonuclease subunit S [Candidatus Competibacter sp.]